MAKKLKTNCSEEVINKRERIKALLKYIEENPAKPLETLGSGRGLPDLSMRQPIRQVRWYQKIRKIIQNLLK